MLVSGCDNPAAMNESTANVQHISQGEFADQVTRASGLIVVNFYATWCGPCRQLSPILDSVAGSFNGQIKFFKVNVDESPGLAQNYQIQAMPTLIFFKNGKLVDHVTGLLPAADLKVKLDALVAGK
jgi:thioredoxin